MLRNQSMEDVMPIQIVMDATGDTRHEFDLDDAAGVAEAKKRFDELMDGGFIAANALPSCDPG
jgi:hypothetical protein